MAIAQVCGKSSITWPSRARLRSGSGLVAVAERLIGLDRADRNGVRGSRFLGGVAARSRHNLNPNFLRRQLNRLRDLTRPRAINYDIHPSQNRDSILRRQIRRKRLSMHPRIDQPELRDKRIGLPGPQVRSELQRRNPDVALFNKGAINQSDLLHPSPSKQSSDDRPANPAADDRDVHCVKNGSEM